MEAEEELDLAAGMVPHHSAGDITAWDHETGLPIVKRKSVARETSKAEHEGSESKSEKTQEEREPLHASTDREYLVQQGKAHAPALESHLKAVSDAVPGAHFDAVRDEKNPDRLDEKIDKEKQPVHTIPDILAGRVAVDTPEAHKGVAEAIKKTMPIIRDKDEFKKGDSKFGYRAHKLQVGVSPDMSAEVHIVPKEVNAVNDKEHDTYDKARTAELNGDQETADKLTSKAKQTNDQAMSKFNARNHSDRRPESKSTTGGGESEQAKPPDKTGGSALKVGDKVTLPGGKPATVAYVPSKSSQLPTYRFKTEDGKMVELRANQVEGKVKPAEQVSSAGGPAPDNVKGTIDVDLDKTLAFTHGQDSRTHIGAPEPAMVDRIKKDIAAGKKVTIFTSRVANDPDGKVREAIQAWSKKHLGVALDVTDKKEPDTGEILDDKAVHVKANTGKVQAAW